MNRGLFIAVAVLSTEVASAQTIVTLNGDDYSIPDHPRVFMDGPSGSITTALKDPDGVGGSRAPRAVDGDPAYEALKARLTGCADATPTCSGGTQNAPLCALWWFMDNDQTDALACAKFYVNSAENYNIGGNVQIGRGCDFNVAYCGIQDYLHNASYNILQLSMARSLIDSQLSAGEKTAFAQKMLNNVTASNGDAGCDNMLQLISSDGDYSSGSTTLGGSGLSGLTAGRVILLKPNLTTRGGWATISTVNSDTSVTLTGAFRDYNDSTNFQGVTNGLVYEVQPWTSTSCGAVWATKNHSSNHALTFGKRVFVAQAEAIDSSETAIDVADASLLPTAPFVAKLSSSELILVNGKIGNTLTPVTRGYWGTSAVADFSGNLRYEKYLPFGSNETDATNNRIAQKAMGALAAGLAGLDEIPTAATDLMADAVSMVKDYQVPRVRDDFTGFTKGGSYYHHHILVQYNAMLLDQVRHFTPSGGSPSLDFTGDNWMKLTGLGALYNTTPDTVPVPISWGREAVTSQDVGGSEDGFGWMAFLNAWWPAADETAYANYYLKTQSGTYTSGKLDDASQRENLAFFLIHMPTTIPETDYRSVLPTFKAFNQATNTPGRPYGVMVLRQGWSSANDTLVWVSAEQLYPGNDHHRDGSPGAYRIYKKGSGSGDGYLLTHNDDLQKDSGQRTQTNMVQFAGSASTLVNFDTDWQQIWLDRTAGGTGWAMWRTNSLGAYQASANASRVLRHGVYFNPSGGQDYVVVFDDIASSAGNTKNVNLDYDEKSVSTFSWSYPNLTWRSTTRGASLLTRVIYPTASTGIFGATSTQTFSRRLAICASTSGSSCDTSNTSAEFLLVHMPLAASTGSMPTTSAITVDANHRAVQIADATNPAVAVFPRTGAFYTTTSYTTTHSGTARHVVTGLDAGVYDVTLDAGLHVDDAVVDVNGALSFTATAGDIVVTQTGAPPPPTIITQTCPAGEVGTAYSCTFEATCSDTPCVWSLPVGTLPTGLSQNTSTGAITGTPTTQENQTVTVRLTDNSAQTDDQEISINITDPPPAVQVQARVEPGSQSAVVQFRAQGLAAESTCSVTLYDSLGIPADQASSNSGFSSRRVYFTGLTASTEYEVQASCDGTAASSTLQFTTRATEAGATAPYSVTLKPNALLTALGVDSARVTCTDTDPGCPGTCSVIVTNADGCGSGCTLSSVDMARGRVYSCIHEWGTDATTWLVESEPRLYPIR